MLQKPEELKTPFELALAGVGWKQYESSGKPYFVSSDNVTVWELPADIKAKVDQAAEKTTASRPAPSASSAVPNGHHDGSSAEAMDPANMQLAAPGQFAPGLAGSALHLGGQSAAAPSALVDIDFDSKEEAERAFMGMLRSQGVTPSWTWEQVLRTTVTQPLFKALRSLSERKAAFEKYCQDITRKEKEAKERSLERNRPSWRTALGRMSEGDYGMKAWWSWEHAAAEIKDRMPDVWRMSRDDAERELLWREYMGELKNKEAARMKQLRDANVEKLRNILKGLEVGLGTRFVDIAHAVRQLKEWREDSELQAIDPVDFLGVYEDIATRAEQQQETQRLKVKAERQRVFRRHREAYVGMLSEMRANKLIQAGTKWKDIFELIKDKQQFLDMLGNPGSSPLELFWDVVDELDEQLDDDKRIVETAMADMGVPYNAEMPFDEWDNQISKHDRVKIMPIEARKAVYKALSEAHIKQHKAEQRRRDRKVRHLTDDLRYALRKLDPPISASDSFETSLPRMEPLKEFVALDGLDDARRAAYDKHIIRLLEHKASRDRDRDAKDSRNGYGSDVASDSSRVRSSKRHDETNNDHRSSRKSRSSLRDERSPRREDATRAEDRRQRHLSREQEGRSDSDRNRDDSHRKSDRRYSPFAAAENKPSSTSRYREDSERASRSRPNDRRRSRDRSNSRERYVDGGHREIRSKQSEVPDGHVDSSRLRETASSSAKRRDPDSKRSGDAKRQRLDDDKEEGEI